MAAKKKVSLANNSSVVPLVSPVLAAVAAGLYPVLFYFSNNFPLVNTWGHLGYFLLFFIVLPAGVFWILNTLVKARFAKWHKYVLPFLNFFLFLFLLKICLYAGVQRKMIVGIFVISVVIAYFLNAHLKKIIVLQFLLAAMAFLTLVPKLYELVSYDASWTQLPDSIEETQFKQKPNVYFIQPDGYVNFSELEKGYYKVENSVFENFVSKKGFTHYPDFRSNYASTLTSNSATFMMKHHYYNGSDNFSEGFKMRKQIVGKNPVLSVFKNNGYQTNLLVENDYLLVNKPALGFDTSNLTADDVPYIGTGLLDSNDVVSDLKNHTLNKNQPQFFFIEFLMPSHIAVNATVTKGAAAERELWIDRLMIANEKLTQILQTIEANDPNALVIIMADHGGFVGMEYTQEIYKKTENRDLLHSMFSANLLIKWPENNLPEFDNRFKSSVNLFRILFAHLSEDTNLLKYLEMDSSYTILNEGVEPGIYQCLDGKGGVAFESIEN